MVTVRVDENLCTGCGICYNDECPEVFAEGDGGISEVLSAFQKGSKYDGAVPENNKEDVKRAAMSCPNSAIFLE